MQKEGRDLIFLFSMVLLLLSIAKLVFNVFPDTIIIGNVLFFLNRLAILFGILGLGGLIYYFLIKK